MYQIELNGKFIGITKFEYADVSMGVAYGKIEFNKIESPYEFFKNYCNENNIIINDDYPKNRFLNTMVIPKLKVYKESTKIELKG